ncbi:MAG: hypothetical protein WDN31_03885 [Hyphomicrobium sp.]
MSDAATALLMAKFYDLHLGAGVDPPTALRRAQAWLRQATDDDLNGYVKVASAAGRLQGSQLAAIAQELRTPRARLNAPLETGSSAAAGRPPALSARGTLCASLLLGRTDLHWAIGGAR